MVRALGLLVVVLPLSAAAQPPGMTDAVSPTIIEHGRSTDRLMIGAAFGLFANHPMSLSDPGAALLASKPLWLGDRYRHFQWVIDASLLVGYGTDHAHGYFALGPKLGANLYFGSVFGFELRAGLSGVLQAGERTVGGVALAGSGGYVFRFWDDDRRRVKLLLEMWSGAYFADDPGNDLAMNAGAFAIGLGYETPL